MSSSESIPEEMLSAYLDGELAPKERREVEVALESDSHLRSLLADLKQLRNEIQNLPRFLLSDDFAKRVASTAESQAGSQKEPLRPANKPTISRPQTYQSRLRMVGGMAAAAAAILVACWAMFPNDAGNGNPQVSSVDVPNQEEALLGPQASDIATSDLGEAKSDAFADDSLAADSMATNSMADSIATDADGVGRGTMGGGFELGNERQANAFELQRREADLSQPFPQAEQVAELKASRFPQPRAADALAESAFDHEPAAAAAAPPAPASEMFADSAAPIPAVESDFGASRRVNSQPNAGITAKQLKKTKAKQNIDAVMYLANADALAFKTNQAFGGGQLNQRVSRGRSYAYRKINLSEQDSLNKLGVAVANDPFDGISIPNGSELLVLEGTPEQVQSALSQAGATPTSVDVLNPKADKLAMSSAAAASRLPGGLERSRMTRSTVPRNELKEANPARTDLALIKTKQKQLAEVEDEEKEEATPRVRVLIVVQPK